ncbi:MAG: GTPase Era [Myxococcales bacterium]|nr:GTPase Era [Myxococcales bacterium]
MPKAAAPPPSRPFRCGLVTLAGPPNAGKSTLLNRLLGEKLAIVSPLPQTTRDQIRGVWTAPDWQAIFIDTPGIHQARSPLNRAMVGLAIEALEAVDAVVVVVDAPKAVRWLQRAGVSAPLTAPVLAPDKLPAPPPEPGEFDGDDSHFPDDDGLLDAPRPGHDAAPAEDLTWKQPLDGRIDPAVRRVLRNVLRYGDQFIVALNKVDAVAKPKLLPVMEALATVPRVGAVIPLSGRAGDGVLQLLDAIRPLLPEGAAQYGTDELTDRSVRFLCAELVREQVFLQTREEVPYGVACEIETFDELPGLVRLAALVHVEKPAQRAILLGKGGQRMKAMATAARGHMEALLQKKVFLEVHVRVEPRWSERVDMLRHFGYVL